MWGAERDAGDQGEMHQCTQDMCEFTVRASGGGAQDECAKSFPLRAAVTRALPLPPEKALNGTHLNSDFHDRSAYLFRSAP